MKFEENLISGLQQYFAQEMETLRALTAQETASRKRASSRAHTRDATSPWENSSADLPARAAACRHRRPTCVVERVECKLGAAISRSDILKTPRAGCRAKLDCRGSADRTREEIEGARAGGRLRRESSGVVRNTAFEFSNAA